MPRGGGGKKDRNGSLRAAMKISDNKGSEFVHVPRWVGLLVHRVVSRYRVDSRMMKYIGNQGSEFIQGSWYRVPQNAKDSKSLDHTNVKNVILVRIDKVMRSQSIGTILQCLSRLNACVLFPFFFVKCEEYE